MKKLKVMMMTLMMCLVSVSVLGQNIEPINIDKSNINTKPINTDSINIELYNEHNGKIDLYIDGRISDFTNNDKIFNLQGIDVTKLNGSLISGVYIVVINDKYITQIFVK